jgi:hypothetical protein
VAGPPLGTRFHNNVGFLDPSGLWLLTTQAREEGAEHAHYRRGLSPELSANCFFSIRKQVSVANGD